MTETETELRSPSAPRRWRPARSDNASNLLDTFVVSAVTTILVVRIFLALTAYPQLGGQGLHIAHVLWGGLLMTLSILLMQSLVRRPSRHVGALLGGVGFGLFIDEIGKFVTADVNYFFRPTYSLIYVVIVVIYLGARTAFAYRPLTPVERVANALDYLKEATAGSLDQHERRRALALLDDAAQAAPLGADVHELVWRSEAFPPARPSPLSRASRRVRAGYLRAVEEPWFRPLMSIAFVALALYAVYEIVELVMAVAEREELDFAGWATLVSGTAASVLVIVGVLLLRRDRLTAYRWLEAGLLVYILVWQVFAFDRIQLYGVAVLGIHLLLFVTVRAMAHVEERERETSGRGAPASGSPRG